MNVVDKFQTPTPNNFDRHIGPGKRSDFPVVNNCQQICGPVPQEILHVCV